MLSRLKCSLHFPCAGIEIPVADVAARANIHSTVVGEFNCSHMKKYSET